MSSYKISYKLLKQQTEEMQKVATQMNSLVEKINNASANLGQDELLAKARASLQQSSTKMTETAQFLNIAGTVIAEIIEEYTGTETRNVSQAEGTKAHSRDFYKNPVAISDAAGESFSGGSGPKMSTGGYDAAVGASVGADAAVSGAEVGAAASAAGTSAGAAAAMSGVEAGAGTSMSGVALGAGVAVAGAAAGVGAAIGGSKLAGKSKEKKAQQEEQRLASEAEQKILANQAAISRAEDALKAAQDKLENIQE